MTWAPPYEQTARTIKTVEVVSSRVFPDLEGELGGSLEDSGITGRACLSARDLAEGCGVQARAGGIAEVRMIWHIEAFKPQNHRQPIT